MKLRTLTTFGLMLLLPSCNKDDQSGVDKDQSNLNSAEPSDDSPSKSKDFELVEFDGFVEISAPITEGTIHEEVVITGSGIEEPVFRTPRPTIIQDGEQGVAPQSATRSESDFVGGDKPQPESEARSR